MNLADYLCSKLKEKKYHDYHCITTVRCICGKDTQNQTIKECKQALQLRINREKLFKIIKSKHIMSGGQSDTDTFVVVPIQELTDYLADNFQEWITPCDKKECE